MKVLIAALVAAMAAQGEALHYTINWQSGLNLGEASINATKATVDGGEGSWTFSVSLDAAVPGFTVRDEYKSKADAKFCTETLQKIVTRGGRKSVENITFDRQSKTIQRETQGGGKSDLRIDGDCAHDAMAFLQFMRQELAQGRLATNQAVYLGSKYDLQLTYTGTEAIRHDNKQVDADKVRVGLRGPKADVTFEILFARDEVRTPLVARLPLALGTFTVELLP